MAHWREVLPPDRLIDVDYEVLVGDPEPQARRLIAACGLDWNDACLKPQCNTRKITTAKSLASASANLPHVGRTLAAVRTVAWRISRAVGRLMPDRAHMLLSIPPKFAVSQVVG